MNALVVYWSKFGHTQQLAETIAAEIATSDSARAMSLEQLTSADLSAADLIILGCPTHVGRLPEAVRPLLAAFPKRLLKRTPAAAFDTSYQMHRLLLPFTASRRLARALRKLGGRLVVQPENFIVGGREGPLMDGELARARQWVQHIKTQLTAM
jgi:menaquinone-dependent protoporphyrinogen IX oxidase